jgi:hypothetical protein
VSQGHGLFGEGVSPRNHPRNLNKIIFDHLNALFPQQAGVMLDESGREKGMNSFVNGALGGTGA